MAHRVIGWLSTVVRHRELEPEVHFHRGSVSRPVACHDPRCGAPRLDVETR